MANVFLENPFRMGRKRKHAAKKGRRARRNPDLLVYGALAGNPRGRRAHKKSKRRGRKIARRPIERMAKHRRKSHKRHRKAHKAAAVRVVRRRRRSHKRVHRVTRRRGHRRGRKSISLKSITIRGSRANPPVMGLLRIPSKQELMAVGIGAVALPFANKMVKGLPFIPDVLKAGWGGIATELVIASLASVGVRRFVSPAAGDVIFILGLANGVQKTLVQLAPGIAGTVGLSEVGYYEQSQLGYVDPTQTALGGTVQDQMPTMV